MSWKMHVYADLQVYICTHPECNQSLTTLNPVASGQSMSSMSIFQSPSGAVSVAKPSSRLVTRLRNISLVSMV
ncbi:hypothetical protein VTN96DRAFT_3745 [Rasamsonia emersonii]